MWRPHPTTRHTACNSGARDGGHSAFDRRRSSALSAAPPPWQHTAGSARPRPVLSRCSGRSVPRPCGGRSARARGRAGRICNSRRRRQPRPAASGRTSCRFLPRAWRDGVPCPARGCRVCGLPPGGRRRACPWLCPQHSARARRRAPFGGRARTAGGRAPRRGFHIGCRARGRPARRYGSGDARVGALSASRCRRRA